MQGSARPLMGWDLEESLSPLGLFLLLSSVAGINLSLSHSSDSHTDPGSYQVLYLEMSKVGMRVYCQKGETSINQTEATISTTEWGTSSGDNGDVSEAQEGRLL